MDVFHAVVCGPLNWDMWESWTWSLDRKYGWMGHGRDLASSSVLSFIEWWVENVAMSSKRAKSDRVSKAKQTAWSKDGIDRCQIEP